MSIIFYNKDMYQRARTLDQQDERKNEILNAIDSLYLEKDLDDIYLKDIAELTKISRTALYSYYKSKEEILFDSFKQHFISLNLSLKMLDKKLLKTQSAYVNEFAKIFVENKIILKVLSTDIQRLEKSVDVDTLCSVKLEMKEFHKIFRNILKTHFESTDKSLNDQILFSFIAQMHGFYSLTNPIPIQKQAMELTKTTIDYTLQELIVNSLNLLLNNLEHSYSY